MRIALVSRELYPYVGGGIAPIVTAAARALSQIADVTVVTSASHREEYSRLRESGDPRVLPDAVRHVWVEEPDEDSAAAYFSYMHAYSARVDRALREAYEDRAPDLIEFCDYLAEGFVTIQARHTRDPWLDDTLVCVRLHTTSSICAVLDGHLPDDFGTEAIHDAEAYCLRHADRLLWPGGDVLATYERYYGADALAPSVKIPDAFLDETTADVDAPADDRPADDGPLRLLYLGRFERRKGVQNLVRAIASCERRDIELTLLGGDTRTGPVQTSVRDQLRLMAADDPRIRFAEPVPRAQVTGFLRRADVVVVPSLWECWPNVAREALMLNRPVLATPVGGLTEMVVPGRSGWLTRDTSARALAEAIESLAGRRDEIRALIASGSPREVFTALTDEDALRARYLSLAGEHVPNARRPRMAQRSPLVSVVVPYFTLDAHVEETLRSALDQTHPRIEVVVVNDGSLRDEDRKLYELMDELPVRVVTQPNAGLSAARNLGVAVSTGEYILPLDADDLIAPEFVERCLRALEGDSALAYATTWVEYMDPDGTTMTGDDGGYMPYGNWSGLIERNNVGGTCSAVIRRRVFERGFSYSPDLTSYEDWLLYWQMARAGLYGAVIPEKLFRYRVRSTSMMRLDGAPKTDIIVNEIRAHLREAEMDWVAASPKEDR